jgi:hypothetical protein
LGQNTILPQSQPSPTQPLFSFLCACPGSRPRWLSKAHPVPPDPQPDITSRVKVQPSWVRRVVFFTQRIFSLSVLILFFAIWIWFQDKKSWPPCALRFGTKIPMYSGIVSLTFDPQTPNPRTQRRSSPRAIGVRRR